MLLATAFYITTQPRFCVQSGGDSKPLIGDSPRGGGSPTSGGHSKTGGLTAALRSEKSTGGGLGRSKSTMGMKMSQSHASLEQIARMHGTEEPEIWKVGDFIYLFIYLLKI
jgi:hypothetical protein